MNCRICVQGIFKEPVASSRKLWESELDLVIKKHDFEKRERADFIHINVPHCENISINLARRIQRLEFIYYGNDNAILAGIFEIFWTLAPFFNDFKVSDNLDIWKNIFSYQERRSFPSLAEFVNPKIVEISRAFNENTDNLLLTAEICRQTVDLPSQTIVFKCEKLLVQKRKFLDADIHFMHVDNYLFLKNPPQSTSTNLLNEEEIEEFVVKEETTPYFADNSNFPADFAKQTIGILKLKNQNSEFDLYSLHSLLGNLGWISCKEIWIVQNGHIMRKFLENVWYYYH